MQHLLAIGLGAATFTLLAAALYFVGSWINPTNPTDGALETLQAAFMLACITATCWLAGWVVLVILHWIVR